MKKIILLVGAALLLSANVLLAAPYETTVNNKINSAFNEAFTGATDVKWYTEDNRTYTAKFTLSNTKVTAFYKEDGSLMATSRYLQADQLPLKVSARLNKKFPGNSIYCVVEYTAEDSVIYFVTLENSDTWTVVKTDQDANFKIQSRLKKA
ncbi:hypothetical protein HGH93_15825 [Chitinophaga polysaccharea]|uniref:hypothetical protein n=1 Tax=Chitinophaga TaxID=79328 RepID=UPI00145502C7|nr:MULTISPECIES: hypothetical protein [Chitinophaga]NLR59581.1 hypothetical protein [Chitinophaga polysaccharea]NLU93934.1 hypothetical protein [Chitinophaga sp. Ak27]